MTEQRSLEELLVELAETLEKAEALAVEATSIAFKENRFATRVQNLRDKVQGRAPMARSLADQVKRQAAEE